MSKKKVLITGANGLVGAAFKDFFLQEEYPEFSFVFVDRSISDLTDGKDVDYMFWSYRPEMVIHCAARVGGIGRNINSPAQQFTDNILMNTHVVDQARKHKIKKLIAFSSVCAFPGDAKVLKEDNLHDGPPFPAHWSYAHSKRMVDVQIEAYRKQYEVDYCSVILGNVIGINDNYDLENGHVMPSLIHKCFMAKKENKPFEVWGNGEPKREFIYATDVAKICLELLLLDKPLPPRVIVSGKEITIRQLVEKICKIMDYYNVKWDESKLNGQMSRPTDVSLLMKTFPHFQFTDLDEAIEASVEYFVHHYPNCRGVK